MVSRTHMRNALIFVDSAAAFHALCILFYAWIFRDGLLNPSKSSGITAIARTVDEFSRVMFSELIPFGVGLCALLCLGVAGHVYFHTREWDDTERDKAE